ncbi:helix-turn-helix domain-containing protein [Zhouia amylolytica]|uniref:Helix-turn-helix type 11 domain-containing protein n=1 Tax=Zhouia amylolytica AD3 TaxID=1286632 RepID=W2UQT6_9FLAO|nr:helix-turn-helix domain-containing protein [Zhouia amylolytica]ETN96378.1 hypothetical protein P278_07220 [Zhouia amylolytica AD3]
MKFRKYQQRKAFMLDLIEKGYPGSAAVMAEKIGISRRTFFEYINDFRMEGIYIVYDKSQKTFIKK